MSDQERMRLRRTSVAFIFQSFGLIPILSAADRRDGPKDREERVRLMLDIVGLGEHARQRPGELPGGQLDSETAKQIMRLLRAVVQSEGVTALVATHDPGLIDIADAVLELEDGKIKIR